MWIQINALEHQEQALSLRTNPKPKIIENSVVVVHAKGMQTYLWPTWSSDHGRKLVIAGLSTDVI